METLRGEGSIEKTQKKWKHTTKKKNVENKNTKICGNQTLEKKPTLDKHIF